MVLTAATAAVSVQDDFERVTDAFAASRTASGRSRASRVLADVGAHPVEGSPDLAVAWRASTGKVAPYRDRALGPAYRRIAVPSRTVVHFDQIFLAGQRARVAVVPDKPGSFKLGVTDEDGAAQCTAQPAGRCDWVPLWTTRFQIELNNPGPETASYYVVIK